MLENDDASDFLPGRLATVLIITSLVLLSAAYFAGEVVGQAAKTAARDCVSRITAIAAAEYVESCPGQGEGAYIDITVPESVERITFWRLLADRTGACSIQYTDGSQELYLPGLPIGSGCPGPGRGGPVVLYSGNYGIRIATEEINGSIMVLLSVEGI